MRRSLADYLEVRSLWDEAAVVEAVRRHLLARYGRWIVSVELLPPGVPRRDWRQTLLSDGWVIVRHPDLGTTLEMADRVGTDLQLVAG